MERREQVGATLIGVGAFLILLGAIFFLMVYFDMLPNQTWLFPWITTYRAAFGGVILGLIILGVGAYARSTFLKYEQKVEELERAKEKHEEKLREKSIALSQVRVEAERKKIALALTKRKLKKARLKAKKKEKAMLRLRGKLGDRSRRLKHIRKLTEV